MRIVPSLILAAASLAVAAPAALAAPPINDNYLASLSVNSLEFRSPFDLTEATTQADIFNPTATGQPFGGGTTENTNCNGTSFGKTVWYDLRTPNGGAGEIKATAAGFTPVVYVYQWDEQSSQISRPMGCTAVPGGELTLEFQRGAAYTIQVGGVGATGGPGTLSVDYFPDSDGDGEYDPIDECPTVPGISRFGGCPPELKVVPSVGFNRTGNGVSITRLVVDRVPKGARVVAKVSGGGSQTVRAKKTGTVTLSKLVGKTVRAGGNIEVRVTLGAQRGSSTYKYGATGSYFKWPVKANGLGKRQTKCIVAGTTSKIETCK